MKLVYKATHARVALGDKDTMRDGEEMRVVYFAPPHKAASEGHVTIRPLNNHRTVRYYVSVIDAKWVEREDRTEVQF